MGNAQDGPDGDARAVRTSRRKAVGGLTVGLAGSMARGALGWDGTPAALPVAQGGQSPLSYALGTSEPQVFAGATLRTATGANIDVARGLSVNLLDIDPGAARELHWHPNAGETNYCLEGEGPIGILSGTRETATFAISPGSITYVPIGDAHYIWNTGTEPLRLLIGFSNETPEHLDFSMCLPWVPDDLLNQTLGVPPGTLPALPPRGDLAVVDVPGPAAVVPTEPGNPFSAHIDDITLQQFGGGTVQALSTDVLSKLDGMTLLKLDIDGGAVREPHWHGNASEFNYCASGTAQVGVVSPTGESWTFVVETGDVAYIPKNWFHYIASLGDEPLEFLAFFDNVAPNRVDLTGMTSFFPPDVLAASFGVDPEAFAALPNRGTVVIAPSVISGEDEEAPSATPER